MNEKKTRKTKRDRLYDRCVYRCCTNSKYATGSRLHRFPALEDPRYDLWVQYTANPRLKSWSQAAIRRAGLCDDHFDPEYFYPNSGQLKRNAIPRPFFFEALKTATLESHQPEVKVGASRKKICAVLPLAAGPNSQVINKRDSEHLKQDSTVDDSTSVPESKDTDPVSETPNKVQRILEEPERIRKIVQRKPNCLDQVLESLAKAEKNGHQKLNCSDPVLENPEKGQTKVQQKTNNLYRIFESSRKGETIVQQKLNGSGSVAKSPKKSQRIAQQTSSCSDSKSQSQLIASLQAKIDRLEQKNQKKQQRNETLRKKSKLTEDKLNRALDRNIRLMEEQKREITVDEFLDNSECTSPLARALVKMQVHKNNAPYSEDEKELAKLLLRSSASTYTSLRNAGCMLPSESAVYNWISETQTSFYKHVIAKLKDQMMDLSPEERFCAVKFDEMDNKTFEEYSKKNNITESFDENESIGKRDELSRRVFVVRLDSLNAKNPWRQHFAYFMSSIGMAAKETYELVEKCLVEVREVAKIRLVTCDQETANESLLKPFLSASKSKPFVIIDDHKYFVSFDFSYLMKELLSTLKTHKVLYHEKKPICTYKDFVDTYKHEKSNTASNHLAHIADDDLFPSSIEAIDAKHAFQMFDRRFAAAIRTAALDPKGLSSPTWEATANFAERINTIIDICNDYNLFRGDSDEQSLLDKSSEIEKTLNAFVEWSSKWTIVKTSKKPKGVNVPAIEITIVPCLEGFPMSVAAIVQTYRAIEEENSNEIPKLYYCVEGDDSASISESKGNRIL